MTDLAGVAAVEVASTATCLPSGVHLAGSIPLASAEEVFRTVGEALGDRMRRIPYGETGAPVRCSLGRGAEPRGEMRLNHMGERT